MFHKRGIPSKRKSLAYIDYVPALCTHRPSLPGTEQYREAGRDINNFIFFMLNPSNRCCLNRAKVVTRFSLRLGFNLDSRSN
ncbi:Hypothetical protein SRAE_X000199150 [Strongyloides ratti]|uniref:Uncharacterized protein n=1 Tax=Strongyloides ratti TaxID=34506 RepID=A0A090MQ41_STRRB|nr:Hypothetical protein SRAE_X000199150 [Strongyloides ratti]CEF60253.1 Hypothetical protein SRAE_X000199150 [Strongyloides ratti]